jgi:hypothetical protein
MYDQGVVIVDYQPRWHVVDRPNIHVVIVQWVIIWMMSMMDGKMGDEMLQNFRRHCQLDEEW